MEAREYGNEFAAAHTGDLRRHFLADATDLIPLCGGGGAQFFIMIRLTTLVGDRKSDSRATIE